MSKVKTEKYFITTYLSDGIITNRMEVSKTTFNKRFNDILKQYHNQETDNEFSVEQNMYCNSYETYLERTTSFSWSICSLDFTLLTCKDGYHFTK